MQLDACRWTAVASSYEIKRSKSCIVYLTDPMGWTAALAEQKASPRTPERREITDKPLDRSVGLISLSGRTVAFGQVDRATEVGVRPSY